MCVTENLNLYIFWTFFSTIYFAKYSRDLPISEEKWLFGGTADLCKKSISKVRQINAVG